MQPTRTLLEELAEVTTEGVTMIPPEVKLPLSISKAEEVQLMRTLLEELAEGTTRE